MTPEELAVELKRLAQMSVIHPMLGRPAARLTWLAAQVDALLLGAEPLEHTFHSGGGWAEDIRWIGRNDQEIGMSSGAPYGAHGFMVIRVTGLLQGFEFENDEMDRVFQAMLLSDTELGSQ